MTVATESRVSVNGVALFTREIGSGPTTIVLHGGPGAHHDYLLPQYDRLATKRTLLYYDQRGGGRSPVARDVPVDWRAHVSDLHATARDRRRFEAAFAERSRAPVIEQEREALQASDLRDREPEAYRRRLFELSVAGYFHDPRKVRDLTPFRLTGRTQQAVWESLGEYDLRTALQGIGIPSLVLAGRHDPIPLDAPGEIAARFDCAVRVFEASGHCPHVEEPERFTEVLDSWLPAA